MTLLEKIASYLHKYRPAIDPKSVTRETVFKQLGLDSMDAAKLVFALEEEYEDQGVQLPDEIPATVGEVIDIVEAQLAEN